MRTTFTAAEIRAVYGDRAINALSAYVATKCTMQELTAAERLLEIGEMDAKVWERTGASGVLVKWAFHLGQTTNALRRYINDQIQGQIGEPGSTDSTAEQSDSDAAPIRAQLPAKPERRRRRPITDPDALAKRRSALEKAREVRQQRLSASRSGNGHGDAQQPMAALSEALSAATN